MSVYICDAGLFSKGSHHFNWACEVSAEFARRGLPPRIFAYRNAAPDVLADTGAVGHFDDLLYDKHCDQCPFDEERNWRTLNESFRADLERIEPEIARSDAIIIIPAITQHQIEGLAQWFVSLAPERRPKLAVCLMFQPEWTPWGDRAIRGAEYYAHAISRIKPWVGRSVLLYTETQELKACFEALTEVPIEVLPHPWRKPTRFPRNALRDCIRFGYLGHPRKERGFHLLPEAVKICNQKQLPFELVVQIRDNNYDLAVVRATELLRAQTNVYSIIGPLEGPQYYRVLDSCDAILLPYSPNMYRARGSGLYTEAIIYGKPIIVTAGTPMARAAERAECVARLCTFNSSSLAATMIDVAKCFDELGPRAVEVGRAWHQTNNAVEYCRRILEFAGYTYTPLSGTIADDTCAAAVGNSVPDWPIGRAEKVPHSPASHDVKMQTAENGIAWKSSSMSIPFNSVRVKNGGTLLLELGIEPASGQVAPLQVSVKINGHLIAILTVRTEPTVYRIESMFPWLVDEMPSVLTIEPSPPDRSAPLMLFYKWGFQPRSRRGWLYRRAVVDRYSQIRQLASSLLNKASHRV
jgi:glycosyltransferase involved in cell wall biosynthesis